MRRLNYVAQPGDNAYLLPKFGPYDYFAIEWGYKPFTQIAVVDGKTCHAVRWAADTEWSRLDQLAAQQVNDPMLRFGGEDESAALDPQVNTNVVGGDPVEAADLGLRNIDRVMPMLIPGHDATGRRLRAPARDVRGADHAAPSGTARGGENGRRRGGDALPGRARTVPPFQPVPAARQRAAVKFLLDRAFATPAPLLTRDVMYRIGAYAGADALQGSNVQLLRRLVDPGRIPAHGGSRELDPAGKGYTGIDMLYDLNDGLFRELAAPKPVIEMYRRKLQRNYVPAVAGGDGSRKRSAGGLQRDRRRATSIPVR